MTDRRHLDELVETTPSGLSRRLLEVYRQMAREQNLDATELSVQLRALLDEAVEQTDHAPDSAQHS